MNARIRTNEVDSFRVDVNYRTFRGVNDGWFVVRNGIATLIMMGFFACTAKCRGVIEFVGLEYFPNTPGDPVFLSEILKVVGSMSLRIGTWAEVDQALERVGVKEGHRAVFPFGKPGDTKRSGDQYVGIGTNENGFRILRGCLLATKARNDMFWPERTIFYFVRPPRQKS